MAPPELGSILHRKLTKKSVTPGILLCLALFCAFGSAAQAPAPGTPPAARAETPGQRVSSAVVPPDVPPAYQDLYSMLEEKIAGFAGKIPSQENTASAAVNFGGELLTANAHRGVQLLLPKTREGVRVELDRLRALGAKSVTVAVGFPILYRPFLEWNGDPGDYQGLVDFYKQLAADVRSRGMQLVVESGALFPGSYSVGSGFKLAEYYGTLSNQEYIAGRAEMAATIAREIRPDLLVVGSEPDTEAKISSKAFLGTPNGFALLVAKIVTRVRAEGGRGIPIGAGVGVWKQDGEEYIRSVVRAAPKLDFVDLHVYPVNGNSLDNLIRFTDVTESLGKRTAICEAWLLKERDGEFGKLDAVFDAGVFARDAFSFWAPLDQKFLDALVRFARWKEVLLLSPYWTRYFHAYLQYDEVRKLTPTQITARANAAAAAAMLQNQFSEAGEAYRRAISEMTTP